MPGETAGQLEVARLDRRQIPPEHQFEALHQATQPVYDAAPVGDAETTGAGALVYRFGEVLMNHMQFDRIRFSRDRRRLANGDSDYITVQWYREGAIHGLLADGTALHIAPGQVVIQDFAHAYAGVGRSNDHRGVVIPRHLLRERDRIFEKFPVLSWRTDAPAGRVLTNTLLEVWDRLPSATEDEGVLIAARLVRLLDGLIAEHPSPECAAEVERGVLSAMQGFLLADLRNPKLGAEDLCRAFHRSRASIYRLFQPFGGVRAYLLNQRLDCCFQALASGPSQARGQVRAVAEHWGFHDASHFNRLFKSRFELAPSELLGITQQARPTPPVTGSSLPSEDVNRVREWLASD